MDNNGTPVEPGQQPASLIRALEKLLRPLVKLLLSRGITYPVFCQWLKNLYIEVAEQDFAIPGKKQTDSRINLLTGIHRKDVKRIRNQQRDQSEPPAAVTFGALLVSRWTGLPRYLDQDGHPLPLPRHSENTDQPSFEELVSSVNKDIRPRVVLDEWLRLGIVQMQDDIISLNTEAFIPEKGFDELAFYFGNNLRDHIAAAAHNLSGHEKRFLERSVYYDKLSPESVRELEALAEEQGMVALQRVNRYALELQQRDAGQEASNERINFGIYFFNEKVDHDKTD